MDWRRWWLVSFLACLAYLILTVLGVFPGGPAGPETLGASGGEFATTIIQRELNFLTIAVLFMNGTIYGLLSYAKRRHDLRFISLPFRSFWEATEDRKAEAIRRSSRFMYASLSYLNISILFFLFMTLKGYANQAPWLVFAVIGLSSGALIGYGIKIFRPDQSLK